MITVTLAHSAADLLNDEQSSAVQTPAPVIHTDPPVQDPRSNQPQDAFGATIMGLLDAKDLASTGSLLIVDTFGNGDDSRLQSLARTLDMLKPPSLTDKGDSVRDAVLTWFYDNTDEGHAMNTRYVALANAESREDKDERAQIKKRQNAVNVMLLAAVETMRGIDLLRAASWDIAIETVTGTSARQCVARKKGDKVHTILSLNALRHVKKVENVAALSTKDMFTKAREASTAKQGTPNNLATAASPNGEQIEPTKIGLVANRLDTTLKAYVEPTTGQFQGLSENNRKELYLLWAFLNATLTDVEKAQAGEVYKQDAATLKNTDATLNAAAAAAARLRQLEAEKAQQVQVPASVETPAPAADPTPATTVEGLAVALGAPAVKVKSNKRKAS